MPIAESMTYMLICRPIRKIKLIFHVPDCSLLAI